MKLLRLMNLSLHNLPIEEQYNFIILLINILIVVNTYTKETFPIYIRYLQIVIKHINAENAALELLKSILPEEIIAGKLAKFKCSRMFKQRIELYNNILDDIEGLKERYIITDDHFIDYHKRCMIENERIAADLLNMLF